MIALDIPHRPFASEPITRFMLPDGLFEVALGRQSLNVHLTNTGGAATVPGAEVFLESTDDPGIAIAPHTHVLPGLAPGASRVLQWDADFSGASPGVRRVSFVVRVGTQMRRIIKKIFVTRLGFDASTGAFSADTPEGRISVVFRDWVRPTRQGCGCGCSEKSGGGDSRKGVAGRELLLTLRRGFAVQNKDFRLCLPQVLPLSYSVRIDSTPPFPGTYADLPFQDPWWKVLLCIIAALLLLAAAIAEATDGSGELSTTGGPGGAGSPVGDCCGLNPSGGGTSYVAAGLVAAAAAAATAAALSDARDPIRKGQDHTAPPAGALTVAEGLDVEILYREPVTLGAPFSVGAKWTYTRHTTAGLFTHSASETNANIHALSKYEVDAPDVVRAYREEPFIVHARFQDVDGRWLRGGDLFVQCFLCGPAGQWHSFLLQDDGAARDMKPDDGTFTGQWYFRPTEKGIWTFFVVAQDVNQATPDMEPEKAAQLIGGMVRTGQLTISFSGGTCALVPDGHVHVV